MIQTKKHSSANVTNLLDLPNTLPMIKLNVNKLCDFGARGDGQNQLFGKI